MYMNIVWGLEGAINCSPYCVILIILTSTCMWWGPEGAMNCSPYGKPRRGCNLLRPPAPTRQKQRSLTPLKKVS